MDNLWRGITLYFRSIDNNMMESKLRCIVQENSNIIRIVPIPVQADRPSGRPERGKKKLTDGTSTGRWTMKEQLAFIESKIFLIP